MTVTVAQLPPVTGSNSYTCVYGDDSSTTAAIVSGNDVKCDTPEPNSDAMPHIPAQSGQ